MPSPSFFRKRARHQNDPYVGRYLLYLTQSRNDQTTHDRLSLVLKSPTAFAAMTSTIGIPIKLLNEAQGHIVTLEIDSGTTYRGKLIEGAPRPDPFPALLPPARPVLAAAPVAQAKGET